VAAATWPVNGKCRMLRAFCLQNTQEDETQEPPGKRIKLSPPVQPQEQKFNFSSLVLSKDGNYLVGVTGEDKCIRVFQIDAQSRLTPLSER
jgi:tRNA (guanine-N(7)-)-methyltransferase subunit TRM82